MKKTFLFIAALAMSFMAAQAADWSTAYSSNVELSTEGGTSASAAKVVIGGTEYDAIKAGASKVAGACVVTIPATTKTLHFHAAGWNKEKVTLDVNGTEFTLVADAGVSNTSPFTLENNPATEDYFTFDPQGATTITIAASETTAGKRFVLFGVNADDGDTPTPPTKELVSLEIGGTAAKMAYNVGEAFEVAGLTVTGTYDDASIADVTSNVNWTITPETFAEASENASVEVIAKIGSIESAPFQVSGIVVTAKPDPVGGNTIVFEDYGAVSFTTSDGAYTVLAEKAGAGNEPAYNAAGKDLRNYAKGTFTLTSHNGNMTKIVFNISAQGLKRQAEIAPSAGAMAYDMDNKVVTWTGDAASVVFTVGEKAVYGSEGESKAGQFDFVSVEITLGGTPTPPTKELMSLEIGGTAAKMAYNVGEAFDVAGLTVIGTYDDASTADVTSKVNWTITPETFAEASESASVTVKANIGAIESAPFQVSGIVVTAKPDPVGGNTIVFEDYEAVSFTTSDGAYTVLAERGGGSSDPAYNATGKDLRNYAKGTFTLTSNNGNMTKIVFNISAQGLKRQAEITPSAGAMAYDMDNKVVTWTGDAASVVFTVGEKAVYGSDDDSKAGQFDFVSVEITKGSTPTDIREAMINANVRKAMVNGRLIIVKGEKAFDLQGRIVK